MRNRVTRLGALVAASTALLAACRQDMHDTPRYEVYEASASFADGRASRNPPVGTVARGQLRDDDWLYTGKVDGLPAPAFPFADRRGRDAARPGALQRSTARRATG